MTESWKMLGESIRACRKARDWTQRDLARHARVSESTISSLERATRKHDHRRVTVEPVLRVLGMPLEDYEELLDGNPDAEVPDQAIGNATLLSSMAALQKRLDQLGVILEQRLGSVVDIIHNSDSDIDITIEIKRNPRQ